jgi:hypothetical protein
LRADERVQEKCARILLLMIINKYVIRDYGDGSIYDVDSRNDYKRWIRLARDPSVVVPLRPTRYVGTTAR